LQLAQLNIQSLVNDVGSPHAVTQFGLPCREAHRPAN
jgi:hypothetical protein